MSEQIQTPVSKPTSTVVAATTPQTSSMQRSKSVIQDWVISSVVCVGLYIVLMIGVVCIPKDVWLVIRGHIHRYVFAGDFLVMGSQTTDVVVVDTVRLNKESTLVVFNTDLYDSPGFSILGESEVLPVGIHKNISITINPEAYFTKEDRSLLVTPTPGMSAYIGILEHTEGVRMRFDAMGYPVMQKLTLR